MDVVIAPDAFGETLSAAAAARAIAEGWLEQRPHDQVRLIPMSDGGEGLLDVIATSDDLWCTCEVADPLGRPIATHYVMRDDTAYIESARASGLALVAAEARDPLLTTTFGVGQTIADAARRGAKRIVLGLGGTATVDGGAGALTALGTRVLRDDGSGVKIGGGELASVATAVPAPTPSWDAMTLLADVDVILADAAQVFAPQKGADADAVEQLAAGLQRWADVAERDLASGREVRMEAGSGAAGGLGFGLRCAFGAQLVRGADVVAHLVGLDVAMQQTDIVVTGEGALDATSWQGKVVGSVCAQSPPQTAVAAVVGRIDAPVPNDRLTAIEAAAPGGPGADPYRDVVAAAQRLAAAW